MKNNIRCIVVDDHSAIRFAIKRILESGGVTVVAECSNGIDAIKAVEEKNPDLIILDIDIPKLDGFDVIKRVKSKFPRVKILILTATSSDSFAVRCYYSGVNGFIKKTDSIDLLPTVVRQVDAGYDFFSHDVHEMARRQYSSINTDPASVFEQLSNRELAVLKGLSSGKTNIQIALDLMLSNKTISTYKTRIIEKTGMSNFQEIIDMYKKCGP